MKEAVDAPPGILKNSKSCVIEIDYSASRLDKIKMKDVSQYHYFQFEEMGVRAWEFEGIGTGKLMQLQEVNFGNSLGSCKAIFNRFSFSEHKPEQQPRKEHKEKVLVSRD